MTHTIGVLAADHVAAGLVSNYKVTGALKRYPEAEHHEEGLLSMPAEAIAECITDQIAALAQGDHVSAVGIGFPGIIRDGIIEESPNLKQVKGTNLQHTVTQALVARKIEIPVRLFNDADVMAAGIAAGLGHLDRMIRVWTLGNGIGFGRYPSIEGTWEGGHSVVTLDPKENYCGCGGQGHLEGVMGNRAMRMRFLDLEPEEVFANAEANDPRCCAFLKLWHRALAAATATAIHMDGPGKFYLTGPNARHINLSLLNQNLSDMVKMSPLGGSIFQIISTSDEVGIVGAALNATLALQA